MAQRAEPVVLQLDDDDRAEHEEQSDRQRDEPVRAQPQLAQRAQGREGAGGDAGDGVACGAGVGATKWV